METTPVHTLNLTGVFSESKRIFTANSRHFLALSCLFLPLSFSLIFNFNPTLTFSGNFFTANHFHNHNSPPQNQKPLIFHLLWVLVVYVLTPVCAIATITSSTHYTILGKPVKLATAVKSLTLSFIPIVSTALVAQFLLFLISLTFLLFVGVFVKLGQHLNFEIDYNSMGFSAVVAATLIGTIVYFHVNWSLAFVVAVAESKWGFAPLVRSSYLVKGMRSVSFSLFLYFAVLCGCTVWVNSDAFHVMSSRRYALLPAIFGSFVLVWLLLLSTAANTVLYMYCKASHGELAINLPADDEKVPLIVTVVGDGA